MKRKRYFGKRALCILCCSMVISMLSALYLGWARFGDHRPDWLSGDGSQPEVKVDRYPTEPENIIGNDRLCWLKGMYDNRNWELYTSYQIRHYDFSTSTAVRGEIMDFGRGTGASILLSDAADAPYVVCAGGDAYKITAVSEEGMGDTYKLYLDDSRYILAVYQGNAYYIDDTNASVSYAYGEEMLPSYLCRKSKDGSIQRYELSTAEELFVLAPDGKFAEIQKDGDRRALCIRDVNGETTLVEPPSEEGGAYLYFGWNGTQTLYFTKYDAEKKASALWRYDVQSQSVYACLDRQDDPIYLAPRAIGFRLFPSPSGDVIAYFCYNSPYYSGMNDPHYAALVAQSMRTGEFCVLDETVQLSRSEEGLGDYIEDFGISAQSADIVWQKGA